MRRSHPAAACLMFVSFFWRRVPFSRDSSNHQPRRKSLSLSVRCLSPDSSTAASFDPAGVSTSPRSSPATGMYPSVLKSSAAAAPPQPPRSPAAYSEAPVVASEP